jgi:hypothetical protein
MQVVGPSPKHSTKAGVVFKRTDNLSHPYHGGRLGELQATGSSAHARHVAEADQGLRHFHEVVAGQPVPLREFLDGDEPLLNDGEAHQQAQREIRVGRQLHWNS